MLPPEFAGCWESARRKIAHSGQAYPHRCGAAAPARRLFRAICLLLLFFGFFMGMQGVIFSFLMSKVIPVERRGFLLGFRNALGGLTASGVAYLGGRYLVEPNLFGNGYATTFMLAFVLTSFGLAMLLGVREPEPPEVREASGVGERLRELPAK